MMPRFTTVLLILVLLLVLLPGDAYAFGAGSIPGYAFLHDRAFRHGDIENILTTIAKTPHHHTGGGGGLFDFFSTITTKGIAAVLQGSAAQTFSKSDVRRVYFGNWLRDYSQAIDIAGLSKMTEETLLIIIQALGFMTFGFATREFLITPERLGVYLPVEHIDNPKGYAKKEGDARKFHPDLRPPVDPKELEIDPTTGMKNYMATEGHSWDTSTAHIRRLLCDCIALGRKVHGTKGTYGRSGKGKERQSSSGDADDCEDMWEAFRLLGSALHTLEDLLAHSNWCEISLRKLGCKEVFCHVGEEVLVKTPNGLAPPLVTGTFGSADFLHSLLGEASDHLSQASVVDLSVHMEEAEATSSFSALRNLCASLPAFFTSQAQAATTASLQLESKASQFSSPLVGPSGSGSGSGTLASAQDAEAEASSRPRADITTYAPPPEVQQFLWDVLQWRDGMMRGVVFGIESIPGLSGLLEQLTDVLNQCVYTLLAPALIPIIKEVTLALKEQSQAVIDIDEQYEVFDNPKASDPTHSILAKDHVDLILNEPAGRVAQIIVENTVRLVVHAWYHPEDDVHQVINEILEAFHHPYFADGKSEIQNKMIDEMRHWLDDFEEVEREIALSGLTKQSIREGKNKRLQSMASSTDNTLSSLSDSDSDDEYNSAYEDSRRSSILEEESGSILDSEAPIERDREKIQERINHARGLGSKIALKNSPTSEIAKRRALAMLTQETWEERISSASNFPPPPSPLPLSSPLVAAVERAYYDVDSESAYDPEDDDLTSASGGGAEGLEGIGSDYGGGLSEVRAMKDAMIKRARRGRYRYLVHRRGSLDDETEDDYAPSLSDSEEFFEEVEAELDGRGRGRHRVHHDH